jgi:riboflavin synthase
MFTGIITHIGTIEEIQNNKYKIAADGNLVSKLKQGSSVAVNGTCLTLINDPQENTFLVEVMPETQKKTMLSKIKTGDKVNLETPMSPESLFEGHIVQGHIDGVGEIITITPEGNSHILEIKITPKLSKYLVDKGSVALNGISLTIIKATQNSFTVGIIPYTMEHTMLQYAKVGDMVNVETDVLAKYVEKLLNK